MNQQQPRSALAVTGGKVVISSGTLTKDIDRLLADCYDSQPIVISDARPGDGDGDNGAVVLIGRSTFLRVTDAEVLARFVIGDDGAVRATLRYQLVGSTPGPDHWLFSRSLPSLPPVTDYSRPAVLQAATSAGADAEPPSGDQPFVDSLDLIDSAYVVSSHAQSDAALGLALLPGINFIGGVRPVGNVAMLRRAFGDSAPLCLHGTVRIPKSTEVTLPLNYRERPWDRERPPGVVLGAALGRGGTLGGVHLEDPRLIIYTPHEASWLSSNAGFDPCTAYSCTLSIPSIGASMQITSLVRQGIYEVMLSGPVSGVSLSKLSSLAEAAGGDDLLSSLPDPLREAGEALGKLSLTYLRLELSLHATGMHVSGIGFDIGMPDFKWKIWGNHLVVEDLGVDFMIQNPFGPPPGTSNPAATPRRITAGVYGTLRIEGVPIQIRASNENGCTIMGRLGADQELPLGKLLAACAPDIPPPAKLTVNALAMTVVPGRSFCMSMSLAGRPDEWVIDVGPSKLKVSDVSLVVRSTPTGSSGSFSGTIAFGKYATLAARFDVPGGFQLRSVFPRINLSHLIEVMSNQQVALPSGFDFVLTDASMLIAQQGQRFTFLVGATIPKMGTLMFEVIQQPSGGWGFAYGFSLGDGRIAQLPGLGALKSIEDQFQLEKLLLVVSSFADASFTIPDMAQLQRPQLGSGKLALPAQASGVVPGLMLFAEWRLDMKSREQKLLKLLLGLGGVMQATLVIGADPMKEFRLYVSQQSTISKHPFLCKFGVELAGGRPTFFLIGSMTTQVLGQLQTFNLTTVFTPGGALLAATAQGGTSIDCGPFKLSNLALQIGVNWSGIPSLGIAATIDVREFSSSLAIFFDSTDPSRSLVAGSLGNLSGKAVLQSFVGKIQTPLDDVLDMVSLHGTHEFSIAADLADELDDRVLDKIAAAFAAARVIIPATSDQLCIVTKVRGASWHLTDLSAMRHYQLDKKDKKIVVQVAPQFYFAPQPTFIGTLKFPQGYSVNAGLSFAGFEVEATIDIAQTRGLSIDAQLDKIVILDDALFSIQALSGSGGPRLSVSTYAQPENPEELFRLPHFYVNGALTLLGIKQGILASVSVHGIDFELSGPLMPGASFDLDVCFGKNGLGASGQIKVGVGTVDLGPLGKAKLNTQIDLDVEIEIGAAAFIELEASFAFAGQDAQIPRTRLDLTADTFAQLSKIVEDKAQEALRLLFKDMNQWANAMKSGAIEGVADSAKVFKDVYGKSDKEAQELASSLGKGGGQAVKAVENVTSSATKSAKKAVKKAKLW